MRILRISDIELVRDSGTAELSGTLDGFRLWYRFPAEFGPRRPGDVFLAAGLLVAMRAGEPLVMDPRFPVSPRFLESIPTLQDIFTFWYPKLQRVEVRAEPSDDDGLPLTSGVGSFFSGGVDGMYTFLKHAEEITHLIFVKGVDMQVDNDELWGETLESNSRFADSFGKMLVPVETNIRRWCHPRDVGWTVFHGAGLASIAMALGFPKTYIAATHTYRELFPWGSHPLTDPLWSTEAVSLVHDGAEASRSDKLAAIARSEAALSILRVCWQDAGYNCGKCEKCLRTMMALRALGLSTSTLPPLESLKAVRRLKIWNENTLSFFNDNLALAERMEDRPLARSIKTVIRDYEIRTFLKGLARGLAGRGARRDPAPLVGAADR